MCIGSLINVLLSNSTFIYSRNNNITFDNWSGTAPGIQIAVTYNCGYILLHQQHEHYLCLHWLPPWSSRRGLCWSFYSLLKIPFKNHLLHTHTKASCVLLAWLPLLPAPIQAQVPPSAPIIHQQLCYLHHASLHTIMKNNPSSGSTTQDHASSSTITKWWKPCAFGFCSSNCLPAVLIMSS